MLQSSRGPFHTLPSLALLFVLPPLVVLPLVGAWRVGVARAAEPLTADPLPDGTAAAEAQIARLRAPDGFKIELYAAEPRLGNPVAIALDERNRVYVAEEYRFNRGTEENRTRPFLLEDDLRIRTLDDRLAMYRKHADKFPGGMAWFSKHTDQVRLLRDDDDDGRADRSTVFAAGFNDPLDGLAAGVLARDGDVFFTCVPNLWKLRDENGDGVADKREVVHRGFGVNAAFLGHDLHGLCFGPDGKLYFSVGDRGYHVVTQEGHALSAPRRGAVFRCHPDGSKLEVVAAGLRNPQELAFDQHGNLFAADNNCDKGDHARLVYVVEGGDSGWNMAYQTIPAPYETGPWHAEKMWRLEHPDQPAWILPPVGKLGAGPSGFAYYPGVGLPERYREHFFMCNYTGNGGVEAFAVRPKGAAFEIVGYHDFLKPIQATDADFGHDGKLYVSDFVGLIWDGGSRGGRIYTVFDPKEVASEPAREGKRLFAEGFAQRSLAELAALLRHPDARARGRAQFALAARGEAAAPWFIKSLAGDQPRFARLHALWGLGQLAESRPDLLRPALKTLGDADAEIRAHAARLAGDHRLVEAVAALRGLTRDESPRVRFFALASLGKLRAVEALPDVAALLRENADRDAYIRHAGVMYLASLEPAALEALAADDSPAARLATLLAWRRARDGRLARFLDDADPRIVTEAARALHDLPLDGHEDVPAWERHLPDVAALLDRCLAAPQAAPEALLRRALHANFRLGGEAEARRVLALAIHAEAPLAARREALALLAEWAQPGPRDRVTGYWRPVPARSTEPARAVLQSRLAELLASAGGELLAPALEVAKRHALQTDDDALAAWLADPRRESAAKVAVLRLLASRNSKELPGAVKLALSQDDARARAAAREAWAGYALSDALRSLDAVLANPEAPLVERQAALATLATLPAGEADVRLAARLGELLAGQTPAALRLDVLEAGARRAAPEIHNLLKKYDEQLPKDDPWARQREALEGGDAEQGRAVFLGHLAAQCVRCHQPPGAAPRPAAEGGAAPPGARGEAGPDLSELSQRHPTGLRQHLLESLLDPGAKIAPGFAQVTVALANGKTLGGVVVAEDQSTLRLRDPRGVVHAIALEEIEARSRPQSPMPPQGRVLTPRQLRDLIEYLAAPRITP